MVKLDKVFTFLIFLELQDTFFPADLLFQQLSIFEVSFNRPHPVFKDIKKLFADFQREQSVKFFF